MTQLDMILSELEGITTIQADLLLDNAAVRQEIRKLLANETTIDKVIEVINIQF